jgi:MarR family transcriptional regulator, organic hydroperoxide resistance regulator
MKRAAKDVAEELAGNLDFLIRDTRLRLYKLIETTTVKLGIPLRIWFPLRALYMNEGITQRELGRILGYGDAHAGVIVGVMQRRHLVYREPSRIDKRRINLYLTPAGRKAAQATLRQMRAINARMIAGFSAADSRSLQTLLMRAHDNLKIR